jgi:CrcB protein
MVKDLLLVGLGGGAGSVLRFLAGWLVERHAGGVFPVATLVVNVTGCLLFGLLAGLAARGGVIGEAGRLLLVTGFCGGYTTFSTFSAENVAMVAGGHVLSPLLYTLASVVAGAGAAWLGGVLARYLA